MYGTLGLGKERMSMKKAWLALLLTSLFTTALVGCSSKQDTAQTTPAKTSEPAKQEEP
jgi:nitrous oxide reductase accessory protein NosL